MGNMKKNIENKNSQILSYGRFGSPSTFEFERAIAKIDELAKGNTMYDLAMIDVMMPKANGFTVLEHIKKEKIKIPSIFILSNLSQAKDVKKAKDLGASEFVIKSNTPINEIISKVKSYI